MCPRWRLHNPMTEPSRCCSTRRVPRERPKACACTHDNLLRNSEAIFACFGHTRASRGVLVVAILCHDIAIRN